MYSQNIQNNVKQTNTIVILFKSYVFRSKRRSSSGQKRQQTCCILRVHLPFSDHFFCLMMVGIWTETCSLAIQIQLCQTYWCCFEQVTSLTCERILKFATFSFFFSLSASVKSKISLVITTTKIRQKLFSAQFNSVSTPLRNKMATHISRIYTDSIYSTLLHNAIMWNKSYLYVTQCMGTSY